MNLREYDVILINSSAGKDSQAMLHHVGMMAIEQGLKARVVVAHCDLGIVEWKGVAELAKTQAAHYGFRFIKVTRPQGNLLEHVRKRRMWPSPKARYCTSDHKRGQVRRVMTQLVDEHLFGRMGGKGFVRILNCMGMRAQESKARAKRLPFKSDQAASNGRRQVDEWLPIHSWTVEQVWQTIRESGVPHHFAYDLGMPRLSCCFCIFAPEAALLLAAKHNPELMQDYIDVQEEIGHKFRLDVDLVQIQAKAAAMDHVPKVSDWSM